MCVCLLAYAKWVRSVWWFKSQTNIYVEHIIWWVCYHITEFNNNNNNHLMRWHVCVWICSVFSFMTIFLPSIKRCHGHFSFSTQPIPCYDSHFNTCLQFFVSICWRKKWIWKHGNNGYAKDIHTLERLQQWRNIIIRKLCWLSSREKGNQKKACTFVHTTGTLVSARQRTSVPWLWWYII